MSLENYPAKVVHLKSEIPKKPGYYWWKEDTSERVEIIELDGDLGCFYRMGDDRPYLIEDGIIGFFGPEVVGPYAITDSKVGIS